MSLEPSAAFSDVVSIVVRLADEGVPVAAIARVTKQPSDEVREHLEEAMSTGKLVEVPHHDWPPDSKRTTRQPCTPSEKLDDTNLTMSCIRLFKITGLQAAMLSVLIRRPEVTKDVLHQVIEQRRGNNKDQTDPKMVDVVICHLRKRMKLHDIEISTIWAKGYCMEAPMRAKALKMVQEFRNQSVDPVNATIGIEG